ncbi:hypothetical protein BpHYR1_020887 [Brachionus plicatilis]|uniref:Uncharacterized protein n=1 Tax=Brachionus plicatilis TaxID=10195 RepID=A0A3M7RW46_BRAPC|nr:hypothetical protein BpHYR1_020887 [Brachionus plicatilis]
MLLGVGLGLHAHDSHPSSSFSINLLALVDIYAINRKISIPDRQSSFYPDWPNNLNFLNLKKQFALYFIKLKFKSETYGIRFKDPSTMMLPL